MELGLTSFMENGAGAGWIGEMLGSFILTFGSLLSIFIAKTGNIGLDTKLKQRGFIGLCLAISLILGLELSKGLGGHGQINPGVTLLVMIGKLNPGGISPELNPDGSLLIKNGEIQYYGHGYEMLNDALPVIGFQFIGGILGGLCLVLVAKVSGRWDKLKEGFKHNTQPIRRTLGVEALGNVFWMLIISGMLGMVMHGNAAGLGFWTLMITAGMAKILIVLVVDDFGGALFNVQFFLGKWIVNCFSEGLPKSWRTWTADGLTFGLNLLISSACGALFLGIEVARF